MHILRGQVHLLLGFYRTRSCDHLDLIAAQRNAANIDDGIFLVRFARHDLVLLGDMHRRFHTRQGRKHLLAQLAFIADRTDHRAFDAARNIGFQTRCFQLLDHRADLFVGDIFSHYYNHAVSPSICFIADKNF